MVKKTEAKATPENSRRSGDKMSSITLGELDRAMAAFRNSKALQPGNDAKAVFAALKSFELDRHLLDQKGAR